jgi:hypothetical protein
MEKVRPKVVQEIYIGMHRKNSRIHVDRLGIVRDKVPMDDGPVRDADDRESDPVKDHARERGEAGARFISSNLTVTVLS